MSDKELLSHTIEWLRYPMTFGVVLLHTIIMGQIGYDGNVIVSLGDYPIFDIVCYISQRCLGDLCVPIFFIISGYLFYFKKSFTLRIYYKKIKRRVKSLLVPYLIWNISFMLYVLAIYHMRPEAMNSMRSYCENFDFRTFLSSFWDFEGGPILGPFWFVRDLFVMALLSYPLYHIIRKVGSYFVVLLFLMWISGFGLDLPGVGIRSLFFFSFGAYMSLCVRASSIVLTSKFFGLFLLIWIILVVMDITVINESMFHRFLLFEGMLTVFLLVIWCMQKSILPVSSLLSKSSFFIFAFHMFIINLPNKYWCTLVPINCLTCSLAQWVIPLVVCLFCTIIYYALIKVAPNLTGIIMGGR